MSTAVATPSASQTKVAFNEPYVSDGLNKKFFGAVPAGIQRGGKLVTTGAGFSVDILPDPATGDSIYTFSEASTGRQLSFRDAGVRTLDLTPNAGSTVFVALFIGYAVGSPTVVEWRTYSEAELFGVGPVPEAGDVVIVGKVVVPGVGPIPASDVTPEKARFAWAGRSKGARQGQQIVRNGGFETGEFPIAAAGTNFPFFSYFTSGGAPTFGITTTSPRSGQRSLEWTGVGPADVTTLTAGQSSALLIPSALFTAPLTPFRSEQLITVSFFVSGTTIPAYTKGSSGVYVDLEFFDDAGVSLGSRRLATDPTAGKEVGTFGYRQIETTFRAPVVPAGGGLMAWAISFGLDLGGPAGTFFVDDLRIFMEPEGNALEDQGDLDAVVLDQETWAQQVVLTGSALPNPPSLTEKLARILRLRSEYQTAPARSYLAFRNESGGAAPYALPVEVSDLLLSGFASTDEIPRFFTQDLGDHILFSEAPYASSPDLKVRVYARGTSAADGGFELTLNARWDTTSSMWIADDVSKDARRFSFRQDVGTTIEHQRATIAGPWADGAWEPRTELDLLSARIALKNTDPIPIPSGMGTAFDICYGLGSSNGQPLWLLCGNSSYVAWSLDGGVTWAPDTPTASNPGNWLACTGTSDGSGIFVVVGAGGAIDTIASPFGGWTARTAAGGFVGSFNGAAHSPASGGVDLYCIVGSSGEIQTSPDAITWTARTAGGGFTGTFFDVVWGGGLFVAVGDDGSGGPEVQTSPDGITWTQRTAPNATALEAVAWGDGVFVAVGDEVITSPDGVTWTEQSATPPPFFQLGVDHVARGIFVSAGTAGLDSALMRVSFDRGVTWETFLLYQDGGDTFGVASDGERLITAGSAQLNASQRMVF